MGSDSETLIRNGNGKNSKKVQHHFVLVHGGGHGAWCWVKLVPELEKAGHHVTAIDLLGAGDNEEAAPEDVASPEEYDGPLAKMLESFHENEKVILVGHSLGGLTLARMSEKFPEKISVAIYLAGAMPGIGEESRKLMLHPNFSPLKARQPLIGKVPKSIDVSSVLEHFYNKSSQQDLEFARNHVRPFPGCCTSLAPPSPLTQKKFGRVPKIYIIAREDRVFSPDVSRKFVDVNHPEEWFELDGDHSLFFSAVERVAEILSAAAAKYDSR